MPKKKQQVTIPLIMDINDPLYLQLRTIAAMKHIPIQSEIRACLLRSLESHPFNPEVRLIDYISRHVRDRLSIYKKPKKGE